MKVGELRESVTISRRDAHGDFDGSRTSWQQVARCRAKVEAKAGSDPVSGDQIQAERRFAVTIPHDRRVAQVRGDVQISWRPSTCCAGTPERLLYPVAGFADPDSRGQWLTVECVWRQ